jgi:hypothetical protein
MNKHEFKRAWREFRTTIRAKQEAFGFSDHDGMTQDLDSFGRYLVAGFTKHGRAISASRMGNSAKGIADLVNPTRGNYDRYYRHEAVKLSRMYGSIDFGRAGA